ncbi:MAG: helix-turn-helix domain-containing protein, partial [Proteobacteria bacterium]|nr:helix-turn-helix domain-containing protein [Pseudomonadota bacterium]
ALVSHALNLYDKGYSVAEAAKRLNLQRETVRYWIATRKTGGLENARPYVRVRRAGESLYSIEMRKRVVRYFDLGMSRAAIAREIHIPPAAVGAIIQSLPPVQRNKKGVNKSLNELLQSYASRAKIDKSSSTEISVTWKYPPEIFVEALTRYANLESEKKICEDLGLGSGVLAYWIRRLRALVQAPPRTMRPGQKFSPEFKAEVVALAMNSGESHNAVAKSKNVSQSLVSVWVRNYKLANGLPIEPRKFPHEVRLHAVHLAEAKGLKAAADACSASEPTVQRWCREAGVKWKGYTGKSDRSVAIGHDKAFLWMDLETPELESWKGLAVIWLAEKRYGLPLRISALRKFFLDYLHNLLVPAGYAVEPSDILSRQNCLPSFHETTLASLKRDGAATTSNYVHEFLDWVLYRDFSMLDDHDRPVVLSYFHNPVPLQAKGGNSRDAESVRSPLPYEYIERLRTLLAEGKDFKDWTWAQKALGNRGSKAQRQDKPQYGEDWFEVRPQQIDKEDPDCVWRTRVRGDET